MDMANKIGNKEDDTPERVKSKPLPSKTEKVLSCFGPTLALEHVFGIFRFHISNGNLKPTTNLMKIFGLFLTTVIATMFIVAFDFAWDFSGIPNVVDLIEDFPSVVIMIQYVTSAVMTSCLLSKANIRIITALAELDSTLHINTSTEFYKKSKIHTIFALVVIFISHLISSVCDFLLQTNGDDSMLSEILNYVLNFVQDLEILIFYLMITMLKARLKVINNHLVKSIHHNNNQGKTSVYTICQRNTKVDKKLNLRGNIPITDLRALSLAYDIIGESCRLVNGIYNYQIFMTLISAFVYIVIALWTTIYYFQVNVYDGNLITIILWCCSEILTVASMAFVCETLLSTRNDTKVLVNELVMDYSLPATTRAQAKAFMELIDAWPLRIYVYDMFSVDITLMLKFISVSTTYLIVIIQISHLS